MEVGSPEWIDASLAKLDELERKHGEHEAALETATDPEVLREHTEALATLDAEIKSLYAQLEAVADDDDDEDEDEAVAAAPVDAPRVTEHDDELSAPHMGAAPFAEPVAAAAPAAEPVAEPLAAPADNPFASPAPAAVAGFDAPPAAASFDDDDLKVKGGGGKWVFIGLVLAAGLGTGGFFLWKNMQAGKQDTQKAPSEPAQVIKAAEVPDDTEAPPTAPSGKATISPNAASGDNDAASKKKKKKGEDKKKPLKVGGGDAPLGGI